MTGRSVRKWGGFVAGMALTSASLSSGFIWACGAPCAAGDIVWTPGRQVPLVFVAALAAWWGYLLAHYAVAGTYVDKSDHGAAVGEQADGGTNRPAGRTFHYVGVLAGIGILVLGMVIGVIYIRQGNHLMTNVGGVLFLGGYAIAHYVETGVPV